MSKMMYEVLWIDDECKGPNLQEIADKAYDEYSIKLNGYESAEEGLKILEQDYKSIDAIILDARFYLNKEDISGTEDLKGLSRIWKKLDQLEASGIVIPRFILSGQTALSKDSTFSDTYGSFYRKQEPEDINQLFTDLIIAADERIETQIRHNHPDIFSIFSLGYLSESVELQVLELIKSELPTNISEIKSMLSNIRSIHESCFLQLEAINVITNSQTSFNNIIKHLSGNKTPVNNYQPTTKEYQNDAIENLHKWIYFTCGKYIHNLPAVHYNGFMISRYGVESLRSGLLELLLWFKKTYEENI